MEELLKAIVTYWASTPSKCDTVRGIFTGGLHLSLAPASASTTAPICILFPMASPTPRMHSHGKLENRIVTFRMFHPDESGSLTLVQGRDALAYAFDEVQLSMGAALGGRARTMMTAQRQGESPLLHDPDGGWQISVDYLFLYDETSA